jgi:DNA-binding beta-propeller fold protein YncE
MFTFIVFIYFFSNTYIMVMKNTRSPISLLMSTLLSIASLSILQPAHAVTPPYKVFERRVLPGNVQWDYLLADGIAKRLYLSRGDHLDVLNLKSGSVIGTVPGVGVHGVALAQELDRGFISNGRDNTVTVFSLSSLKIVAKLPTGVNPDAIVYDPASKRVFAANGKSGSITAIDAVTDKVVGTTQIDGKLEFAVVDNKGKLFVNVEDHNQIAVVDTTSLNVLQRFDLGTACDEPAGLSMDVIGNRLYAGCHNQKMVIVDAATGTVVATPSIGRGSDATYYDAETNSAFSSNGEGSLTVISGKPPYAVEQVLQTMPGARTMALDAVTHRIYLVSAESESALPVVQGVPESRPKRKEGTFTLLTVGR